MDRDCGNGAGGEAGNGLDQRGGEVRMVVGHKVEEVVDIIVYLNCWLFERQIRYDDVEARNFREACRGSTLHQKTELTNSTR